MSRVKKKLLRKLMRCSTHRNFVVLVSLLSVAKQKIKDVVDIPVLSIFLSDLCSKTMENSQMEKIVIIAFNKKNDG